MFTFYIIWTEKDSDKNNNSPLNPTNPNVMGLDINGESSW